MTAPVCLHEIARYYQVEAETIIRVAETDHQQAIGPMGIDPRWLPVLQRAGFSPEAVKTDICMNIAAGAWILKWAGAGAPKQPDRPVAAPPPPAPPPSRPLSGDLRTCLKLSAQRYRIPEQLFLAVIMTEGGKVGRISRNANGSYDMGPAQINSSHLPELARMGITRDQVINDGCLNLHVGAWILARALNGQTPDNPAEFWRRVGNYNSATPEHNRAYQARVWKNVVVASHPQRPAG